MRTDQSNCSSIAIFDRFCLTIVLPATAQTLINARPICGLMIEPWQLKYEAKTLSGSIRTSVPFSLGKRHSASPANGVRVQDLRIYSRVVGKPEIESLQTLSRKAYLVRVTRAFADAPVRSPQAKNVVTDRKSTRLNSSHVVTSRMPSSA